jgi:hypothetical protein
MTWEAFLNSRMASPSPRATSGNFLPPNSSTAINSSPITCQSLNIANGSVIIAHLLNIRHLMVFLLFVIDIFFQTLRAPLVRPYLGAPVS